MAQAEEAWVDPFAHMGTQDAPAEAVVDTENPYTAPMPDVESDGWVDPFGHIAQAPIVNKDTPSEVKIREEDSLIDKLLGTKDYLQQSVSDTMASVTGLTMKEDELMEGVEGFGNARQIGVGEAGLQMAGAAVGAGADALITTALHKVPQEYKDHATEVAVSAMSTVLGQNGLELLQRGGTAWEGFKKKHPETAKSILAGLEVGAIVMPSAKLGSKMISKGKKQVFKKAQGEFADKIAPIDKIAAGTGRGGQTTEGTMLQNARGRVYNPDAEDLDLAGRLTEVPGAKASRTATYNQAHVSNEVRRLSKELESDIIKIGNPEVDKDVYMDSLGLVVQNFKKSDEALTLTGDAAATSEKILMKAIDIIDQSDGTALGLLKARRELDRWLGDNPGKAFDPQVINAKNAAMKVIRDNINTKVDDLVPDVGVKAKLKDQHKLLVANDYLTDTMRAEGENMFSRALGGLSRATHVGPVGAMTTAGALTGGAISGLGMFAGAASGAAVWAIYKGATSATRRKYLGHILKTAEMSKADRILIIDMLQQEANNTNNQTNEENTK